MFVIMWREHQTDPSPWYDGFGWTADLDRAEVYDSANTGEPIAAGHPESILILSMDDARLIQALRNL